MSTSSLLKTVDIVPEFVVIHNFTELSTAVRGLQFPDAQLNAVSPTCNKARHSAFPPSAFGQSPADKQAVTSSVGAHPTSSTASITVGVPEGHPRSFHNGSASLQCQSSQPQQRSYSTHSRINPDRKILCVWDVDDTLVASGSSGIRQHRVFRDSELRSLFKSMQSNTRHLLLSQGSVDDVFASDGTGRLRFLKDYFYREPTTTTTVAAGDKVSQGKDKGKNNNSKRKRKKDKRGFGGLFDCGAGSNERKAPSQERDPCVLERGTIMVRLSKIKGSSVAPDETAFMFNEKSEPLGFTQHGAPPDHRWLVLRPCVWGISLASLNSLIAPSCHTAFVNGKMFRKMDVVWSLASTGAWDAVFFIDNNLSEVGVVRYGQQISNLYELRDANRIAHFFKGEYLLLSASAKLRALERQHGRDITVPPTESEGRSNGMSISADTMVKPNVGAKDPTESAPSVEKGVDTEAIEETVMGEEYDEEGRSKRGVESVTPTLPNGNINGSGVVSSTSVPETRFAAQRSPTTASAHPFLPSRDANEDKLQDGSDLMLLSSPSGASSSSLKVEESFRTGTSPSSPSSPVASLRTVQLVIANFHMDSEKYRVLLKDATVLADDDIPTAMRRGEGSKEKELSAIPQRPVSISTRYVGQPTFMGDTSCTNEEYAAMVAMFLAEESAICTYIDNDLRSNNYVEVRAKKGWTPDKRFVHVALYRHPLCIPHMRQYYEYPVREIEKRLVGPLDAGGGRTSVAIVLKNDAHSLYQQLLRESLFIDPFFTGDVSVVLFEMYVCPGEIPKTLSDDLKKKLKRFHEPVKK